MELINNLIYILKDYKKEFFRVLFIHLIHSFLISLPSGMLVLILWELFKDNIDYTYLWNLVGILAIALVIQLGISLIAYVKSSSLTFHVSKALRMKLGIHFFDLSLGLLKKYSNNELNTLFLQDIKTVEGFFSHTLVNIITGIINVILLMSFLFFMDARLALILLLGIVLIAPSLAVAGFIIKHFGIKHLNAKKKMTDELLEFCYGFRHIKTYNQTKDKLSSLKKTLYEFKIISLKLEIIPGPSLLISILVVELFFLFMIKYAMDYYTMQSISIPTFILFLILGYRVYEPVKLFLLEFLEMKYMNNSLNRIIKFLNLPKVQSKGVKEVPNFTINFENVNFNYDEKKVLEDITCKFEQDKISAIVGFSGEGKTTILNLIARFYDVNKGKVKIGGIDIKDLDLNYLYSILSEVFQDVYLFNDSIYENIKIAKTTASKEEVIKACKKANCMEFIEKLENGIDTKVGEGGFKLSGGEKQRISIARAILKNAPIVLLDEATSSLDAHNEVKIQEAILNLCKNKTVIIIAHKLKSIQNSDCIYVLNNKNIVYKGNHEGAIKNCGIYKQMWEYQQKSFEWKI